MGLALLSMVGISSAVDLGVVGRTYGIAEKDFVEQILDTLRRKQKSGELDKLKEEYKTKMTSAIQNPRALGLPKTVKPRVHYYDPTTTFPDTISDPNGNVIVAAGTTVNPFDTITLHTEMLFFDASDKQQVEFARRYVDSKPGGVKPILVGGSYLDLMKKWKRHVYYDQRGTLVARFSIQQVPAIVAQDGKRLRITEVTAQ